MAPSITVTPSPERMRLEVDGVVLADSASALILREGSYPPVVYVPRADVAMAHLRPHTRRTRCPWKGEAAHFSAVLPGRVVEIAAWSYEAPLPGVAGIAGHLAFYLDNLGGRFTPVPAV